MTDTTANIAAKGCNSTGITEELAEKLHANLGKKIMAVVELVADSRAENLKGKDKVTLSILTIDPAPTQHTEEHLRELARAFYFERALDEAQPTLDGAGPERTVEDVLAAGQQHRPHPFLPDDAAKNTPICDICGALEAAPIHSTQELIPDVDEDDEEEPQLEDDDQGDDTQPTAPADEDQPVDPWEYDAPEPQPANTIPDPFSNTPA